ncbi:serine/threonine-protein kinase ATM-like isoform X2 [Primulina tabacum]|uniref:serine/threonine-protein kinase ATM-like isoform X2 n=1 Tax=Primulina tabacum TaxID=48773 RepID=UPI003F5A8A9E
MPFQLWRNITMMVCLDVWSGTPSLITLTRLRLLLKVSLARLFFAIAKRKILQVLHFILELFNLLNAKLYEGCSECRRNSQAKPDFPNLSDAHSIHDPLPLNSREKLILDVEMDMNGGSIDVDRLGIDGSQTTGSSVSLVNQKLNFLSIISSFFPILSLLTWEIMFNLREKENDHKYLKNFLCILSRHPHWSSCRHILDLSNGVGTQNTVASSFTKRESEECLTSLGDLVTKVFDNSLFDWYYRAKLVNCLCNFVLLRPQLAQLVIDKLFMLLRDPDYRVRLCLARRIGVLFQTWDGHFELFQDVCFYYICCCFYRSLPKRTSQCCAWQLSKETCYTNRTKFLEELMGPILFNWVACGVSLVALVEARGIFASNLEPMNFIKYCCPWLLPALILQEDANSLKWVAKVACQPCAALVKSHFVHIFSVCMAMHCSKKAGWERGSRVLETSILLIVHISEHERDELINKKELVAFPDFDIFNEIQDLHQKIRQTYSPRVHLLNFVKRPHYVPPRLLLCRSTQKVLIWSLCRDLFLIYKES